MVGVDQDLAMDEVVDAAQGFGEADEARGPLVADAQVEVVVLVGGAV